MYTSNVIAINGKVLVYKYQIIYKLSMYYTVTHKCVLIKLS